MAAALAVADQSGDPVEIPALRTEFETVYANPDQTLTTEISGEPVRTSQSGDLVPVDTSLDTTATGRLAPDAVETPLTISGDGGGDLARLNLDGPGAIAVRSSEPLTDPSVSGAEATFPVAGAPGQAVTVTALPTGFATRVVLDSAPADPPVYSFTFAHSGFKMALQCGSLVWRNPEGHIAATSDPLSMWDSRLDAAGERLKERSVAATLTELSPGVSRLELRPSMAYLTDPDTVYPVFRPLGPNPLRDIPGFATSRCEKT